MRDLVASVRAYAKYGFALGVLAVMLFAGSNHPPDQVAVVVLVPAILAFFLFAVTLTLVGKLLDALSGDKPSTPAPQQPQGASWRVRVLVYSFIGILIAFPLDMALSMSVSLYWLLGIEWAAPYASLGASIFGFVNAACMMTSVYILFPVNGHRHSREIVIEGVRHGLDRLAAA